MDFDYELILSQTASLAIGNHPGSSLTFPGDADLPDDAMEVVGGSNNTLPLHFDPETVVVGGWLTAHDVSRLHSSLGRSTLTRSGFPAALSPSNLDWGLGMLQHTLCLNCLDSGCGTPARFAVVGTIANRDIFLDGDIGTVALELDLFCQLDRDALNMMLQRTYPPNNGTISFTLNMTREFKVYIPRVPPIFDTTDDL